MNSNDFKRLSLNFSGLKTLIVLIAIVSLLGSLGLGWLVNWAIALLLLLLLAPVVALVGLSWWARRNLVSSQCPTCGYGFAGFAQTECRCPSCGEPLDIRDGTFQRRTPPGTIDVEAIDLGATAIDSARDRPSEDRPTE